MSKRTGALGLVVLAALILLVNRAAYKGYFQDDEIDNLNWAPRARAVDFLEGLVTPRFAVNNFRPVGHFYFYAAGRLFDLNFPPYVAVLQCFHLCNVLLLWMVARQLRAPPPAAFLCCLFFAFHMALFDCLWKPMYVFDVLCGTFCLLAILMWAQRRWVFSFVAFWFAYKAKEIAVMLPAVLVCYEFWLGERRWKPLIPFFLASLSFGLQGLLLNPNKDNPYAFHFTFAALRETSVYYAGRVFLVPYLGFLAPLAAIPGRNRRAWFGLAMTGLLFFPLLFLPGRIFSAYCYVPFAGLALALSGLAETVGPYPVVVFLLLFAPLDLHELRARRNVTLDHDNQVRAWVTAVRDFAKSAPPVDAAIWKGSIPDFAPWGVVGAIHYAFQSFEFPVAEAGDPGAADLTRRTRVVYITWDPALHHATVSLRTPETGGASFIDFNGDAADWQLEKGWFDSEGGYRWTEPVAVASLTRPAGARRFVLRVLAGPGRLAAVGSITVRVWLNDRELEPRRVASDGWQDLHWDLAAESPGSIRMKLEVQPPFHPQGDSRTLGIAVQAFGFVNGEAAPR